MTNIEKIKQLAGAVDTDLKKKLKALSSMLENMWPLSLQWSVHR